MDYLLYILFILGIMGLCILAIRLPGIRRLKKDQLALSERALRYRQRQKQSSKPDKKQQLRDRKVVRQDLSKVPTPWGWPGHQEAVPHFDSAHHFGAEEVGGLSETYYRFIHRLLREKQTMDDEEFLLRRDASLRAMIEGRYERPVRAKQMHYQKVKSPRLRDPSQPHDQMDNFPSGKTSQIMSKLHGQPRSADKAGDSSRYTKKTRLNEIKKPWGW